METQLRRYEGKFNSLNEPSMVFTNSERGAMNCPRFWLYDYVQNINTGDTAPALSYGVIVHRLLEEIVREIQRIDTVPTISRLVGFHLAHTKAFIHEEIENPDPEQVDQIMTNIERSLEGWRRQWVELLREWKVIGVELDVSAPIRNKDGSVFRGKIPRVAIKGSDWSYVRPSRIGEFVTDDQGNVDLTLSDNEIEILTKADSVSLVEDDMPFYIAGRIDVLLQNRWNEKELAILDHKTTSSLSKYHRSLQYDIQLPTYAYLVENGENMGVGDLSGCKVTTCFFDLLHSKLPDIPKPLKSGKMSVRASCPSWLFELALEKNNLDRGDYIEKIKELELNDTKYFQIVKRELLKGEVKRMSGELFSVAQRITNLRSVASRIKNTDTDELDRQVPRQPFNCTVWGNCKYANNCLDNNLNYGIIDQEPKIQWFENPKQFQSTTEK